MSMRKIKVLIVDDSLLFRNVLKQELSKDPLIEIVGTAADAIEAQEKIGTLNPDILTLDIEMPKMDGITFLKIIMKNTPIKVVLVSSLNIGVFDALDSGAVDFVKKPDMGVQNELANFLFELKSKIKIANVARLKTTTMSNISRTSRFNLKLETMSAQRIIAIGASTGGTEAILKILEDLPKESPGIIVTQHMPPGFTKMYADRLNRICKMEVKEAANGDRLTDGLALIAPGDQHLRIAKDVKGYYVKCKEGEKVSGHCPSVDVMFESVAEVVGKNAIGVILTGMGKDGADGLLKMKKSGSLTIGQDRESCVVYGMPKVAYDIGAVMLQSPITEIANLLIKQLNKK